MEIDVEPSHRPSRRSLLAGAGALGAFALTGCSAEEGRRTVPSAPSRDRCSGSAVAMASPIPAMGPRVTAIGPIMPVIAVIGMAIVKARSVAVPVSIAITGIIRVAISVTAAIRGAVSEPADMDGRMAAMMTAAMMALRKRRSGRSQEQSRDADPDKPSHQGSPTGPREAGDHPCLLRNTRQDAPALEFKQPDRRSRASSRRTWTLLIFVNGRRPAVRLIVDRCVKRSR